MSLTPVERKSVVRNLFYMLHKDAYICKSVVSNKQTNKQTAILLFDSLPIERLVSAPPLEWRPSVATSEAQKCCHVISKVRS